jgi:hypothetical protein
VEKTMSRSPHNDNELRNALRSLLCDIADMYQGAEVPEERGHAEEVFGPFSVGKLEGMDVADVSVSWPNLAISMRNARKALRKAEAEEASS